MQPDQNAGLAAGFDAPHPMGNCAGLLAVPGIHAAYIATPHPAHALLCGQTGPG